MPTREQWLARNRDTDTVAELEERLENRCTLQGWIARWDPIATAALQASAPIVEHAPIPQKLAEVWGGVEASVCEHRLAMGLLGSGS